MSRLLQVIVDGSALGEHKLEADHGDEARDGVGEDGEGAPEFRAFDIALIQQQRHAQSDDEVQQGGYHSPQDVPDQDLEEGAADLAEAQNFAPRGERPVRQLRIDHIAAEIRKGDEDHEHDGQDGEDRNAHQRHGQGGDMEFLVRRRHQGAAEFARRDALGAFPGGVGGILDIGDIQHDPEDQQENGEQTQDEHGQRIIAGDA